MDAAPKEMPARLQAVLPWLICPQTWARSGREIPLQWDGVRLRSSAFEYVVTGEVANLRLPFDQQSATSYDDILGDFPVVEPSAAQVLTATGMQAADFKDTKVLLVGTAQGIDINWILSLQPRALVCLDYSTFIERVAQRNDDGRLTFLVGDACDLPFASGTFDIALSMGCIQHTRSPELAAQEMMRVLRSGGKLNIANLYSRNEHNQRISMLRHKYRLHEIARDKAKAFLRRNAMLYTILAMTGLWRLHRRFPFPGILQYSNLPKQSFSFYLANAEDYYLAFYRHLTSEAEVRFWADRLGGGYDRTPKGHLITKR
ncbi:class I SAM-dependent methyltransferase [Ferrovibrio sp.]|uniref:class I SAM-dependent methyltransferase n=1 Tax=Ferrovibrio sp. TaxID=1917215 RepID=UPI003519135E